MPRLVAARGLAPGRHGVAAAGGLALATAVRMVDGVHGDAADGRADAQPALAAGLAQLDVLVLEVADLADRGHAVQVDAADFAAHQADLGVVVLAAQDLSEGAGGAADLAALAGLELDVVDLGADGDVADRERVAHEDVRVLAAQQLRANLQAVRREDVALLAVGVDQEGDAGGAVRIVFDRGDLGGDPGLVALEVDGAVAALVAAADVAGGDAAVVVAAAGAGALLDERALRLVSRDLLEAVLGHASLAGSRGLEQLDAHGWGTSCLRVSKDGGR